MPEKVRVIKDRNLGHTFTAGEVSLENIVIIQDENDQTYLVLPTGRNRVKIDEVEELKATVLHPFRNGPGFQRGEHVLLEPGKEYRLVMGMVASAMKAIIRDPEPEIVLPVQPERRPYGIIPPRDKRD